MFLLAAQNKIRVAIVEVNLSDIEEMWNAAVSKRKTFGGGYLKRLIF